MVDRYTKAILTVIATALVALVIQGAIRQSRAMDEIQMVKICDSSISCVATVPASDSGGRMKWALAVSSSN